MDGQWASQCHQGLFLTAGCPVMSREAYPRFEFIWTAFLDLIEMNVPVRVLEQSCIQFPCWRAGVGQAFMKRDSAMLLSSFLFFDL